MNPFPGDTKASAFLEEVRKALPSLELTWSGGGHSDWLADLGSLTDEELLRGAVADDSMAAAVRSGLLLRADFFDEPHALAQDIHTPTGSYWHGLLHRREPDCGNARYWFRRVGSHPVFEKLFREVESLAERPGRDWQGETMREILARKSWDPFQFIDLCEAAVRGTRPGLQEELECLQELEIDLLLRYSYRAAIGDGRRKPRKRSP